MYFDYSEKEMNYLISKDKKLGQVIEQLGFIQRAVHPDLFSSAIHHIVGQQISTKALTTIWQRMNDTLLVINVDTILTLSIDQLQAFGITFRKAHYIHNFAQMTKNKELDLNVLTTLSDDEVIEELIQVEGIGVWTAEMILLFSCMRKNIFSYHDLAIHRGLQLVYHHKKINKKMFEKYRKRFSPYCSVASIYLWAVAGGALEKELK
ncbi:MAG: DNA-3-methyladenine glycosylase 2 family protein [Anaerorhabdus sp.]|uniref:DNA-3-methyladenine glycosylase family protein n=1 Tax=Anaerorhabdus sp. TaxID=1872524 RepID=UPI002FC91C07